MKLTMVRHTAVDVPGGVCYGFSDVSLRSTFETEAALVKEQLNGKAFDQVYTSPLSRCTKLADFCGYLAAFRDERLRELNFGDWEMKSWMEINKEEATLWFADWLHYPTRNGESYLQMYQRISGFLDELVKKGMDSACIFAHAGVVRLAHVYAGVCPLEESFEFQVEYGQVFDLEV